jgi:hypothetical protein
MPFSASVILSLALATAVTAAPKARDYPEVIPGPGLPSLASLNLTSAQLYEMRTPESTLPLVLT